MAVLLLCCGLKGAATEEQYHQVLNHPHRTKERVKDEEKIHEEVKTIWGGGHRQPREAEMGGGIKRARKRKRQE